MPGGFSSRIGRASVVAVVILSVWEVTVHALGIWSSAIPAPSRVLLEIWSDASLLRTHAWYTAVEALSGLFLAVLAAYLLSALAASSPHSRSAAAPHLAWMARFPWIALGPLVVIWTGPGRVPATAVCFLVCLLPVFKGILAGFHAVPDGLTQILRLGGADSSQLFFKVRFPASLPFLIRESGNAFPLALGAATVTEFVGSDDGIGFLLVSAGSKADLTRLFAALAVLLGLSLIVQCLLHLVERAAISRPWSSYSGNSPRLLKKPETSGRNPRT